MWIENATDHSYVLYTPVSQEPGLRHELVTIKEIVSGRDDCNVIISLADIEILTSSTITQLLEIHNSLSEHGRMLILCKVGLPVRGIFRIEGLSSVFNIAADIWEAQEVIQEAGQSEFQQVVD
jgi:anti-anti-sigma factor